jgi:hypothetical protein
MTLSKKDEERLHAIIATARADRVLTESTLKPETVLWLANAAFTLNHTTKTIAEVIASKDEQIEQLRSKVQYWRNWSKEIAQQG